MESSLVESLNCVSRHLTNWHSTSCVMLKNTLYYVCSIEPHRETQMIKEFKSFLKENSDYLSFIFVATSCTTGILIALMITCAVIINVDRSIREDIYQQNLLEYKKCAANIKEYTAVESYCGNPPTNYTIW